MGADASTEIDFEAPSRHPNVSGYSAYNSNTWFLQTDLSHDGKDALQSGNIGSSGWSSTIILGLKGPGVLSFWWSLPTGSPSDFFRVMDEGREVFRVSGTTDWVQQEVTLGPKTYQIEWDYFRDPQSGAASGFALLDEVRFSPTEASRMLFTSDRDGDQEIYRLDYIHMSQFDGSNQFNLSNHPANDWGGVWSPDGSQITFVSDRDGDLDIWVMNADGTNPVRLTNDPGDDFFPAWSPDGSQIAFATDRDGRPNIEIYVITTDGSNLTRLTDQPLEDNMPSWSPDGMQIAFSYGFGNSREIYLMNADGSNRRQLTLNSAADLAPVFSPAGNRIAFHSNRDGNSELYVMDADGSNQTNLSNHSANDADPSWSPDGTQIAFTSDRDGNNEVHVIDLNGLIESNIIFSRNSSESSPAWESRAIPPSSPAVTVADGLDNSALSFVLSGDAQWFGQADTTHDGTDAIQSGRISSEQTTTIETTVTGPGTLTFWWKVSSEENYDYLRFSIDGGEPVEISGELDWEQMSFPIEAGVHTSQWSYSKDGDNDFGLDAAWLDQVAFGSGFLLNLQTEGGAVVSAPVGPFHEPDATVELTATPDFDNEFLGWAGDALGRDNPLTLVMDGGKTVRAFFGTPGIALDTSDFTWIAGGSAKWFTQSASTHDGVDALQSGPVTGDQESWIETTVIGPGTLTFWWRVSSEENYDYHKFSIDGGDPIEISGELDWVQKSLPIEAGIHSLRWIYSKDGSNDSGLDAAWLDQVLFEAPSTQVFITPSAIAFGDVFIGEGSTQQLTLLNTGQADLNVASITSDLGAVLQIAETAFTVTPGSAQNLALNLRPSEEGALAGTLTITANTANSPIRIAVSGNGLPPAGEVLTQIFATPSPIAFGNVGGGDSSSQQLTLLNVGQADLNVASITSDLGAVLQIAETAFTVTPGSAHNLALSLAPSAEGALAGTLTITANTADSPIQIPITGNALPRLVVNTPPFISPISDQVIDESNTSSAIPFIVSDIETPPDELVLSATSSNIGLIPVARVVFGGGGQNRTVTITPSVNQTGVAAISISVGDGDLSASTSFNVEVPATGPILHPSDNNPADNRISITELTAYAAAWKRGDMWPSAPNPIPIEYVTRAGTIWKAGEVYEHNPDLGDFPLSWISEPAGLLSTAPGSSRNLQTRSALAGGRAIRSLPLSFQPGRPVEVRIEVAPPPGGMAYAIEETLPGGWSVSEINENGLYDSGAGKVRWGPFLDENPRTLSFDIIPSHSATGIFDIKGIVSFDGSNHGVTGPAKTTARYLAATFIEPASMDLIVTGAAGERVVLEQSDNLVEWHPFATLQLESESQRVSFESLEREVFNFFRMKTLHSESSNENAK